MDGEGNKENRCIRSMTYTIENRTISWYYRVSSACSVETYSSTIQHLQTEWWREEYDRCQSEAKHKKIY